MELLFIYFLISCQIVGYFKSKTNVLNIEVSVLGIQLGNYEADITNAGLDIKIDLSEGKGALKFYRKTKRELWLILNLRVSFDGTFSKDARLIVW